MRWILLLCCVAIGACRAPYMSEWANLTVLPFEIPPYGTPAAELNLWFDENRFAPAARVYESETDLRRLPGAPLAYGPESERSWWLSRMQTVRDLCVSQKIVYYKLDVNNALSRAILTSRSRC